MKRTIPEKGRRNQRRRREVDRAALIIGEKGGRDLVPGLKRDQEVPEGLEVLRGDITMGQAQKEIQREIPSEVIE